MIPIVNDVRSGGKQFRGRNDKYCDFSDEASLSNISFKTLRRSANEAIFREWCVEYKITTFNNTKNNINTTKKKRLQFNLKVDVVLFDTQLLVEKEIESLMDIMIDVIVMCRPCTYNY
jgi:hypothetical protein